MSKKILPIIIAFFLLLVGCEKSVVTNSTQQNKQSPLVVSTKSPEKTTAPEISCAIDYNQYIRKTWVEKDGTNSWSFCISKIVNGEITGRFTTTVPAVPNHYDMGHLTGIINNDTAECQFNDTLGDKGSLKLVFKSNDEVEATLKLADKSKYIKEQPKEGTFRFIPYNIKNIEGFSSFENQSFMVDLNSWSNVRFVTGKLIGGNHIPVVFYLTDKYGNILYDFIPDLPYSLDVKAVSFVDVNKDGLKDVIIILVNSDGSEGQIATVYFQKNDGTFNNDPKLDREINDSENNKDIKTVMNFLLKKL